MPAKWPIFLISRIRASHWKSSPFSWQWVRAWYTFWSGVGECVCVCVWMWGMLLSSLYHHCASFGRPIASIERSLWRPLCLHSTTTATFEPPGWQWFCPHSTSFAWPAVPPQQLWSFKEGTRVVLQQLHRNRTFWVWVTTEHRNHFSGRSKVARRSQPCVKGAWVSLCIMHSWRHRWRHEVTK